MAAHTSTQFVSVAEMASAGGWVLGPARAPYARRRRRRHALLVATRRRSRLKKTPGATRSDLRGAATPLIAAEDETIATAACFKLALQRSKYIQRRFCVGGRDRGLPLHSNHDFE